jgi:hypothetical protein
VTVCCYVVAPASVRGTKQPWASVAKVVEGTKAGRTDTEEEQVCFLQVLCFWTLSIVLSLTKNCHVYF